MSLQAIWKRTPSGRLHVQAVEILTVRAMRPANQPVKRPEPRVVPPASLADVLGRR